MKHSRKILSLLVFFALMLSFCIPVMAAPVDDLKAALTNMGVPQDKIGNVVDYLQKIKITDSQYQSIMSKIDETSAILKGNSDVTALSDADALAVEGKMSEAAQLLGLKATFSNGEDGNILLDVKDSNNNIIFSMDSQSADSFLKNYSTAAVKVVINDSKQVTNSTTFTPTDGSLKQTGTNYGNLLAMGSILTAISVLWIIRNKRLQRCR